jgi:hypothetical protein
MFSPWFVGKKIIDLYIYSRSGYYKLFIKKLAMEVGSFGTYPIFRGIKFQTLAIYSWHNSIAIKNNPIYNTYVG